MKKYLVLAILCCVSIISFAQEDVRKGFTYQVNLRYLGATGVEAAGLDLSNVDSHGQGLRLYAGYNVTSKLTTSIGFGAETYKGYGANTFPLVAQVKYHLSDKAGSFYAMGEGGTQIRFSEASDNGYVAAIGIGKKFSVSRLFTLDVMAGYNFQKTTDVYQNVGAVTRNSLMLGVGLSF